MPRVLLFGAAWSVILLLAFAALRALPGGPSVATELRPPSVRPSPPPPPPRAGMRFPGWTVTRAYSAHHMMVVEVETERPATARQIAVQVVEPIKDRYDEVLVYVRTPDSNPEDLPARRVQWTKREGYVEVRYDGGDGATPPAKAPRTTGRPRQQPN